MRNVRSWVGVGVAVMLLGVGWAVAEDPAPTVKVSAFAPAEELSKQVDVYLENLEQGLAVKDDYDEAKQARAAKDANTLAALLLSLAMTDEENPRRAAAGPAVGDAKKITEHLADYDATQKAVKALKGTLAVPPAGSAAPQWEEVCVLPVIMKQVAPIYNSLKRGVRDPKKFAAADSKVAGQAVVLAAIAQAVCYDRKVPSAADLPEWQKYCNEMRDAAGEVNAAARANKQKEAEAAVKKMDASCSACHAKFRKEE